MTNKEVIWWFKRLQDNIVKECDLNDIRYADALRASMSAIDALEKQVPQKPIVGFTIPNNTSYKCPNCELEIWALDEHKVAWGHPQEFCEHCGQAILWEDK